MKTGRVYWRDFCFGAMPTGSAPNGAMARLMSSSISIISSASQKSTRLVIERKDVFRAAVKSTAADSIGGAAQQIAGKPYHSVIQKSLTKLCHRLITRAVNCECIQQSAHLKKFAYMPHDAAQREARLITFRLIGCNQERTKGSAGQIKNRTEVD